MELTSESLRKRQVLVEAEGLTNAQEKMKPVQPSVVADRYRVVLFAVPSLGRVNTMIRLTGIGDHDRREWLIRISGMRNPAWARLVVKAG